MYHFTTLQITDDCLALNCKLHQKQRGTASISRLSAVEQTPDTGTGGVWPEDTMSLQYTPPLGHDFRPSN